MYLDAIEEMESGDADELPVRRDQETIDLADFIDEGTATNEDGAAANEDENCSQLGTLNSRVCSSQGVQEMVSGTVRENKEYGIRHATTLPI